MKCVLPVSDLNIKLHENQMKSVRIVDFSLKYLRNHYMFIPKRAIQILHNLYIKQIYDNAFNKKAKYHNRFNFTNIKKIYRFEI